MTPAGGKGGKIKSISRPKPIGGDSRKDRTQSARHSGFGQTRGEKKKTDKGRSRKNPTKLVDRPW